MPNTNLDVLYLVSQFMEPCPVLYTRLAMVNRDFYRLFTSDKLWAPFNAYNKRAGIFAHFLKSTRDVRGYLKLYWCFAWCQWGGFLPRAHRRNLYLYLGYLCNPHDSYHDATTRKHMVKLAVCLEPRSFPKFTRKCRDFYDLNLLACQKRAANYYSAADEFATDDDFLTKCIQAHQHDGELLLDLTYNAMPDSRNGEVLAKLWELDPSKYVGVLCYQYIPDFAAGFFRDRPEFRSTLRNKITDRNTALVALKGNSQCLRHFPEYSEDLEVIMAALDTFKWQECSIPLLENNPNHNLVAKVLDNFPHLLYLAPQCFQKEKQRLFRFLEWAPFIHDVYNSSSRAPPLKVIFDNITESTWSDPEVAGQITDYIYTHEIYSSIPQGSLALKLPSVLRDDFEWIKKRVFQAPRAWSLASDRLKRNRDLFLCAIESLESFAKAPREIKERNDSLGERLPHDFDSDYEVLVRLFSVLLGHQKRDFIRGNGTPTIEVIKAMVAPNQDRERVPVGTSPDNSSETVIAWELQKYATNQEFIQALKSQKDDLGMLWIRPQTAKFANTHLGPPPPDLCRLFPNAELDPDLTESLRLIAGSHLDTCEVDVATAVSLVRADPGNFKSLPTRLKVNLNVLFATWYLRFLPDPRHSACRPQYAPELEF